MYAIDTICIAAGKKRNSTIESGVLFFEIKYEAFNDAAKAF